MRHSGNFLLPFIIVEENSINSTTFIFKLYFLCFEVEWIISFFYLHKKKVLGSRKISTSSFRWVYLFWDVQNTIRPFLETVYPSVCTPPKSFGHCTSRTRGLKWMKLYIQLHLYVIWSWVDFGVYRSRSSNVIRNFWFL